MKAAIYNTVNSGLYIYRDGTGIMIDFLHAGEVKNFSPMPKCILEQLENRSGLFAHTSALFFTHLHFDHFDCRLFEKVYCLPSTPIDNRIFATNITPSIPYSLDEQNAFAVDMIQVFAIPTTHDAEQFKDEPHRIILVCEGDENILIAGDAIMGEQEAEAVLKICPNKKIDAIFLNVYHLYSKDCHQCLKLLKPERIFLYHLPFKEDDVFKHHKISERAIRHFPKELPMFEIPGHMAWIDGKAAKWVKLEDKNEIY